MTDDPIETHFSALEPGPDARRRMRLAVLAAVEAEQTDLLTLWWRTFVGGRLQTRALFVAAAAVVVVTTPAVALPLAFARQLAPVATELASLWGVWPGPATG